jgi:preprotein translocase subunit SecD
MGAVRLLRTLAPLALVAGLLTACGGGSGSNDSSSGGDSTILGASSGFEIRTVYARYAPGVPFGPQIPQAVVKQMQSQVCPMKPKITDNMLMECDAGKTVYLLQNPIVNADVGSATPMQIGHKNLWYVEVHLAASDATKLASELPAMTGEQLAFSYDGTVLASVAIDSSLHADHFAITGTYTKASATQLAHDLTS